eukprot:TRINITY_DN19978_c0_g1_i1.p1 TRINITY_DN19978_c0_g1~~TRINITY_DN19978_c0_g1_i1.p1  ORF type:complete len:316 (-),score=50.72 TRINITY_DN19978_c0_g1_i1:30-953(-)
MAVSCPLLFAMTADFGQDCPITRSIFCKTVERREADLDTICAFYDAAPIARLWEQLGRGNIHVGYWPQACEADDASFDIPCTIGRAADRLTDLSIAALPAAVAGVACKFIDIGCGAGAPALRLNAARGCHVTGVTISARQHSAAVAAAAGAQQAGVDFRVADALHLPFCDACFDAGWFLESIFHMGHRAALLEASRVLRPGAALVITDFLAPDTDFGDEAMEFYRRVWHAMEFVTEEAYLRLAAECGFAVQSVRDLTDDTLVPTLLAIAQAAQAPGVDPAIGAAELLGDGFRTRLVRYALIVLQKRR